MTTTTTDWHASITWPLPTTITDEQRETLAAHLPGFGIAVENTATATLRVELDITAGVAGPATRAALDAARDAYTAAFDDTADPIAVSVETVAHHEARLAHPDRQDLLGLREAAQALGVSPQRVDQLWRSNPRFPQPVAQLAAGVVFTAASIEAAKDRGWARPGGRPRKSA